MEYLSERVSVDRQADRTSVVISARVGRVKERLLLVWVLAWALCGAYVFYLLPGIPKGEPLRQFLLVFLAFWVYFLIKIGKAALWRLKGFELWRIKNGTLTIKDSLFGYGKATDHFVDNIQKLGLINEDPASWKWQWNQSSWVIGGERLGFEYLGRKVVFGKGLTEEEARRLVPILKDALKQQLKMQ
jgi:hypothetical protein